jgi:hypothetical protein
MTTIIANWKKIIGWASLIFVVFQAINILVLITFPVRIVGDVLGQLACFALYFLFFRRTATHRALLGTCVFLMIQAIDIGVVSLLSRSIPPLLDWGMAVSFAVGLLAYVTARMSSNNSFKPKPLRGSA